jgi:hypothetical protein
MTPDIPRPKLYESPIEGEVTMDGEEKIIIEVRSPTGTLRTLEGYIDLSPMESGDIIIIRQYIKLRPDEDYRKHAEEIYMDEQPLTLLYIHRRLVKYGAIITAQQTAGTYKTLKYQFYIKRV